MSYYYYFVEIKNRGGLLVITAVSVVFTVYEYKEILLFLICVNTSFSFIHTSITEIFYTYIKLISFVTNQVCFIYFFFHLTAFLSPGLYIIERQLVITLFYTNIFTFIFVILFLNTILLPLSFEFFLSFQNVITSKSLGFYFEAKIEDYFCFYLVLYNLCLFYCQFFVLLLGGGVYYCDNNLAEIKLFRKLFYFLFCCLFSNTIFFSDIFVQMLFCFYVISIYELTVFCLFLKKAWQLFNK